MGWLFHVELNIVLLDMYNLAITLLVIYPTDLKMYVPTETFT